MKRETKSRNSEDWIKKYDLIDVLFFNSKEKLHFFHHYQMPLRREKAHLATLGGKKFFFSPGLPILLWIAHVGNGRSISGRRRRNLVNWERREFRIFEKITVVIGRRR